MCEILSRFQDIATAHDNQATAKLSKISFVRL